MGYNMVTLVSKSQRSKCAEDCLDPRFLADEKSKTKKKKLLMV